MKITFFLVFIFFFPGALYAQDMLYKTDGTIQEVKIFEINDSQVKYKKSSNLEEGPLYVISKENVLKIVYANGQVEIFSPKQPPSIQEKEESINSYGRNFIFWNGSDFFFASLLTFGYEYTFGSGNFSFKIPFSMGLGKEEYKQPDFFYHAYYNKNKIFSIGLDFYFYPKGQGPAKFFSGPSIEYGQYHFFVNVYTLNSYNSTPTYVKELATYYALLFQNGILFQPSRHINVSINVGLGISKTEIKYTDSYSNNLYSQNYYNHLGLAIRGGLSIGYKF